jgi:hypothetical protein
VGCRRIGAAALSIALGSQDRTVGGAMHGERGVAIIQMPIRVVLLITAAAKVVG